MIGSDCLESRGHDVYDLVLANADKLCQNTGKKLVIINDQYAHSLGSVIWLPALLALLPPWLVLASLLGVINGAACFMLVGRDVSRLAWYALLGLLAASLGQVVAAAVQVPRPLQIGDVNVMVTSLGACGVVLAARVCRL